MINLYEYRLKFCLNKKQRKASFEILINYKKGNNILLDAVCGAGKTEMLLEVIKYALNNYQKVGFACPRKELTIDLYQRINEYFNHNSIGLVVGNHSQYSQSNFIFLTTHQLKKYQNYFDLLIIDEIDAFPFCDNFELENDAFNSSKKFIFLSATVPLKYYKLVKENKLAYINNFQRHHYQTMPVPCLISCNYGLMWITLLKYILKLKDNPLIIFVPTIKIGRAIHRLLNVFFIKNYFVHSKNLTQSKINDFRSNKVKIIISTSVLERGITLKGLNIIVYHCSHFIFNEATLIQMCGRVGRDSTISYGHIFFLGNNLNKNIDNCIKKIKKYNEMLYL